MHPDLKREIDRMRKQFAVEKDKPESNARLTLITVVVCFGMLGLMALLLLLQ